MHLAERMYIYSRPKNPDDIRAEKPLTPVRVEDENIINICKTVADEAGVGGQCYLQATSNEVAFLRDL